jgi:hypothetical protein
MMNKFILQGAEETFGNCIVPTIAFSAHALFATMRF